MTVELKDLRLSEFMPASQWASVRGTPKEQTLEANVKALAQQTDRAVAYLCYPTTGGGGLYIIEIASPEFPGFPPRMCALVLSQHSEPYFTWLNAMPAPMFLHLDAWWEPQPVSRLCPAVVVR
jgi:hypothetical protein